MEGRPSAPEGAKWEDGKVSQGPQRYPTPTSEPATKNMGIFRRPRSASLGDIPQNPAKGEKRAVPSSPQEQTPKRGKGGPSPSYAQVAKSHAPNEEGDWKEVTRKTRKKKKKKRRRRRRTLCKKRRELSPDRS